MVSLIALGAWAVGASSVHLSAIDGVAAGLTMMLIVLLASIGPKDGVAYVRHQAKPREAPLPCRTAPTAGVATTAEEGAR